MSVKASVSQIQISPRKVGEVAALVRGRSVEDALTILEHTPRRAAKPLSKVILSAKANAENNHNYQVNGLMITSLDVGPGPALKRYRPAAHGRAQPYKKRTSNIFVEVDGKQKVAKKKTEPKPKKADDKSKATKKDAKKSEKKEDK